jgi:hypothetical protein
MISNRVVRAFDCQCKGCHTPGSNQGVTKRCRLSWLTNSALVYEIKCWGRGGGGGGCGISVNEYSSAHGAQINFGDITPYLTYDSNPASSYTVVFNRRQMKQ